MKKRTSVLLVMILFAGMVVVFAPVVVARGGEVETEQETEMEQRREEERERIEERKRDQQEKLELKQTELEEKQQEQEKKLLEKQQEQQKKLQEKQKTLVEKLGDLKDKFLQKKTENQEKSQERQTERIENRENKFESIADRVAARFATHEEKLTAWISRVKTHLANLKAKGKDTAKAEVALTTAETSLATAVKLGDEAVAKLRAIAPADWETQKPEAKAAKEAVGAAQKAYAKVIQDFKLVLVELKKANTPARVESPTVVPTN